MQPKVEESLTFISIPETKEFSDCSNCIILAKRDAHGDEVQPEAEDFFIQSAPDWFKPDMLKPTCSGLEKDYRVSSVTVYRDRLVLTLLGRRKETLPNFELTLAPRISNTQFMLALYLAEVFECLAQIELSWSQNSTTKQDEFEVLFETIDKRLTSINASSEKPAAKSKIAELTPAKTRAKPKPKAIANDTTADIIQRLERKGLIKAGRASTTKWTLMDCANYIAVLSSVIKDRSSIQSYVTSLRKSYGLPSRSVITEYLGDNSTEWIENAREWLK